MAKPDGGMPPIRPAAEVLDHLVLATPDLRATVADLAERLGVPPGPGGQHLGLGTRNHLLGLGAATYLEVIGPDPDQPEPERPRPFGIDDLDGASLVTWAARTSDIDATVAAARAAGWDPGPVVPMQRRRPDGVVLAWRLTFSIESDLGGLLPFFIDWGTSPHPSTTAPTGVTLVSFRGRHPEPGRVAGALAACGVDLPVDADPLPSVVVELTGPAGSITLRTKRPPDG